MKTLLSILLIFLCATLFCSAIDSLLKFSKPGNKDQFIMATVYMSFSIIIYKIQKYLEKA